MAEEPRQRGLSAIDQVREARGTKPRMPSPKFWGWIALILVAAFILHWKRTQGEVESEKQKLLAEQRELVAKVGPRWTSLRDRVERWTLELAKDPGSEVVELDTLKDWDFRDKPGIYLRLRVDEAVDGEAIRKGAKDSLRDGFTACLSRVPNPSPLAGAECKKTKDCPQGLFCNENNRCAQPAQPFNLRVAYRTLHLLSDEWVRDVQGADNDMRIKVLSASFEEKLREDVSLSMELLNSAQYYLVVLDEMPAEGAPQLVDGGSPSEALQAIRHTARVGIWRLKDDKLVLRVRREAGGELLGATPELDPEVMEARQRQANSCALALAVRQAMGDTKAGATPPPLD